MNALLLKISGNWAHFKKVDTNNNPLTHDFITKTAFLGLLGAVNGVERKEMRELYPILSEDILYSVALNKPVKKESWGFTLRSVKANADKAPWQFEFLKNPDFNVIVALKNNRSKEVFETFKNNIQDGKAYFTPTLGLANCPADIELIASGSLSEIQSGSFSTVGFISNKHEIEISGSGDFRIGFEKIASFQNNDFWNDPEKYIGLAYSNAGNPFKVKSGAYYEFTTEKKEISKWFLI